MAAKVIDITPLNMLGNQQSPANEIVRGSRSRALTADEREYTDILLHSFELRLSGTGGCEKGSVKNAMGAVLRFLDYVGLPPWDWRERDVDEFLVAKVEERGIAAATQAHYLTYLRAFQKCLLEDTGHCNEIRRRFNGKQPRRYVTDENSIPIKRKRHHRVRQIKPLSPVQCQKLQNQYDEEIMQAKKMGTKNYNTLRRDKTMTMLTLMTGVRVEELVKIRRSSFRRDPKYPQFGDFALLTVTGKGKKTRTIRLFNPMVRELMEWYINDVRPSLVSKETDDPDLLFLSERGHKMCTVQVRRSLTQIVARAGIPLRVTPHLLRHTYATEMKDIFGAEFLQKQLGHEHLSTTLNTYYHPDPEKIGDEVRQGINSFTLAINGTIKRLLNEDND